MTLEHGESQRTASPRLTAALWAVGIVAISAAGGAALGALSSTTLAAAAAAGAAAAVVPAGAAAWLLRRHRHVTAADRVTLARVVLTGVLTAGLVLVLLDDLAARSWLLAGLAAAALCLDLVDGWVARRSRSATRQGALLDAEADAALLLVLSGLAVDVVGWWVLVIGLMRYLFLLLSWAVPALRQQLPPSRVRRLIGGVQGVAMLGVLAPAVPLAAAAAVAVTALVLLILSFCWDVLALVRRRPAAVERPVSPEWLGQRRRADHQAREQAAELVEALNEHLESAAGAGQTLTVIDVGAGTGSNLAWLAPRLDCVQRWILLDHDTQVLSAVDHPEEIDGVAEIVRVVGSVQQLPALVRDLDAADGAVLVTCSALLDVLSRDDAEALAETICGAAGSRGTAALLSLSVTGEVDFFPPHPFDESIAAAFNAHQRREGRLGPDAVETLVPMLQECGGPTALRATDWQLDHSAEAVLEPYVTERAEVAVEHDPGLASAAEVWVKDRLAQVAAGQLRVRVGHADVLRLPPC